jgi:putative membrane protein
MSQQTLTILSTAAIVLSGVGLLTGWYWIRARGDRDRHRTAMLSAAALAGLFLVLYVARWVAYGSKPFAGTGAWRTFFLATLLPHIILATALAPLVLRVIYLALIKQDFAAHRRLARVTLPLWLYVAASGWVIYYLLYVRSY